MIDKNTVSEAETNIRLFLREGRIMHKKDGRYTEFFLRNAQNSFNTAKLLFKISTDYNLKKSLGYTTFNGFLWVINSSYY